MLKYIGKAFIVGIPARDLTEDEVEKHGRKFLLDSGLYADDSPVRKVRKNQLESVQRSGREPEEE